MTSIMLSREQKEIYKKLYLFLLDKCQPENLLTKINRYLIPELSDIVLDYLDFNSYPSYYEKGCLLLGSAGTGKTFLISYIIKKLLEETDEIINILAPTNKALNILRMSLDCNEELNYSLYQKLNYQTISRFLNQKITYTKDGKIKYKTTRVKKDNLRYIFIDEASMIGKNNWNDIKKYILQRYDNVKIVFIGDKYQLPPVNEKISPIFNLDILTFELKKIQRTKNIDILSKYNEYKNAILKNTIIRPVENKNFKYTSSITDIIDKKFGNNDKIITYSNKSVDYYNQCVRKILFNNPKEKFLPREKLIFKTSVKLGNNLYYANDEFIIQHINTSCYRSISDFNDIIKKNGLTKIFKNEIFKVIELKTEIREKYITFSVIDDNDEKSNFDDYFEEVFEKIKSLNKKDSLMNTIWEIFYHIKYSINIPVNYSYASTIYKAQGSTYNNIYIDYENIKQCVKDKQLLLKSVYTSVSRGSNKIYLCEPSNNDYYKKDLKQYPFLYHHDVVKNIKLIKDTIIYTKNNYNNRNIRKIVYADVLYVKKNIIRLKRGEYRWDLCFDKDDIIIYKK